MQSFGGAGAVGALAGFAVAVQVVLGSGLSARAADMTPQAMFEDAAAGHPFERSTFDAAVAAAKEDAGVVPLGIYEGGPLTPLDGPVTFDVPDVLSYQCDSTNEATGLPASAVSDSRETYLVRDNHDGTKEITFSTIDAEGVVTFIFVTDGEAAEIAEISTDVDGQPVNFVRDTDGGYTDAVSGERITPDMAEVQIFKQVGDAAVSAHPFWFADTRELSVGDRFMEDSLRTSVAPLVSALSGISTMSQGGGQTSIELDYLIVLVSGESVIDEAAHLVFEGGFGGAVEVPQGSFTFDSTFSEAYDRATTIPTHSRQTIDVKFGDVSFQVVTTIACAPTS